MRAQTSASSPSQSNAATANASPAASIAPIASPTPIPFSDVVAQVESTSSTLKEIASSVSANTTTEVVERDLPILTDEINARLEETARAVEDRTSLERLRTVEAEWRALARNLPQWKNDLTDRARKLESDLRRLNEQGEKWQRTLAELRNTETPPEVLNRIEEIIQTVAQLRRQIETNQARMVTLQNRVAEQQKRVDDAINSIRQTREALVGQLLIQDSQPIWSRDLWGQETEESFLQATSVSLATQFATLSDFARRNRDRIVLHLLIFLSFLGVLLFLRRRARSRVEKEPNLKQAAVIFYLPISTALILAILFSSWIYSQTPQVLRALLGAIALVPAVIILRKLVQRPIYGILYSLVVFYFLDQLRTIIDPLPLQSRLLFSGEMLGGFIFFLWLRTRLARQSAQRTKHEGVYRAFEIATLIALPIFAVSFLADAFGYVSLARLLGNAVLRSTYAGFVLYAAVRIIDGLIVFALRFRPLNLLKMVQDYRREIGRRARKVVRWIAFGLWLLLALELLTLREPLFERVRAVLTAELNLGSLNLSAGNVLLFAATVWASFALSRFVRFALEEDVYPRVELERGIPYAISTVLNYVILLGGFFLAVAAAGFDLTRFTILAGAFGVGIGFGLQNIVNNFVSGLILLFERPVKVGDVIQIGDATGVVQRIGIRASVVRIWDNSDIIVPNSKLISDNVTNWTFSGKQRGIEIPIRAAYGTDPRRIIELLTKVAVAHPLVAETPPPQIVFDEFGTDLLRFKLRAWTHHFDKWVTIRSDLAIAINETFAENDIKIPHV